MGFGGNMYIMNFPVAMTKEEADANDQSLPLLAF